MEILDDKQGGPQAAPVCRNRCRKRSLTAIARSIVHGIIQRMPLAGLRKIEKVVKKRNPLRRHNTLRKQPLSRLSSRFGWRAGRQIEQAQEQRADRILSFAHAEVEDQAAMRS